MTHLFRLPLPPKRTTARLNLTAFQFISQSCFSLLSLSRFRCAYAALVLNTRTDSMVLARSPLLRPRPACEIPSVCYRNEQSSSTGEFNERTKERLSERMNERAILVNEPMISVLVMAILKMVPSKITKCSKKHSPNADIAIARILIKKYKGIVAITRSPLKNIYSKTGFGLPRVLPTWKA